MWFVYIIECEKNSLYTGITNDLERRYEQHKRGTGAKFTRAFGAKKIVYHERYRSKSKALRREAEIKSWPRAEKLALIAKSLPKKRRS